MTSLINYYKIVCVKNTEYRRKKWEEYVSSLNALALK